MDEGGKEMSGEKMSSSTGPRATDGWMAQGKNERWMEDLKKQSSHKQPLDDKLRCSGGNGRVKSSRKDGRVGGGGRGCRG